MRQQHQLEQQQKQQQVLTSASATSVTSASSAEYMYDAQVSCHLMPEKVMTWLYYSDSKVLLYIRDQNGLVFSKWLSGEFS